MPPAELATITKVGLGSTPGGWAAVNVKPRGRTQGEGRQLAPEQEMKIRRLICDKTPDQLKLGFALWNRQAVSQLITDRLGIQLPIRTIGEYLKRWGFTSQKPIKKAYEQRPAEVRKWISTDRGPRQGRAGRDSLGR